MKKSIWGPCIWKTIHTLTVKIKDSHFYSKKNELIQLIFKICTNLPCPLCSSHSINLLKKYKVKYIMKKEDLIKIMFKIHNEINIKLKKEIYDYEKVIPLYKSYSLKSILNDYYDKNMYSQFSEKMMLYNFHKNEFLKYFKNYVIKNIDNFDP